VSLAVEPITEADPLDALIAAEERELLTASIQRLPDAHRGVVQLAYVKGLGGIRIAEQLGLALGTVYNRMLSGRAKLREYTL
jgi:RNA polymerase sigma factor (sigma-70 family)